MSAVQAMEDAFGVSITEPIRALRRLMYCGEWIESHTLHIYMLHAPDFLSYPDAIRMAKDHPEIVTRGLQLKKAGNEIVRMIGGREIHPINVRTGGFYRAPSKKELFPLLEQLKWAADAAEETVRWVSQFHYPSFEQDYEFVSMRHPDEYPMNEGKIVSSQGLDFPVQEFDQHIVEQQMPHTNALHSSLKERGAYLVGPMARYNLNFDRLSARSQESARSAGLDPICRNPFQSIIIRSVEVLFACDEAVRLLESYEAPDPSFVLMQPREGVGFACTEAPRGLLYHRYRLDETGKILDARIVPPTSQNQKMMEEDLRNFIPSRIDLPEELLTLQCEQTIRNYDPCISCATHFLQMKIDRE
jgi:coenzyme F420-reducing hydrogenase alpha subunit